VGPSPVWTAENLAPPGFDPRTVQPVAQSLYRLSYLIYPEQRRVFTNKTLNYRAIKRMNTFSSTCLYSSYLPSTCLFSLPINCHFYLVYRFACFRFRVVIGIDRKYAQCTRLGGLCDQYKPKPGVLPLSLTCIQLSTYMPVA
jgi:hypothetical protein